MLFDEIEPTEEERIESAINFLTSLGYVVLCPSKLDHKTIKNSSDLVDYFYALLQYYNPDRRLHYTASSKKDAKHAAAFVKKRREETGAGNKRALEECSEIVRCVVENESVFKFLEPLHSFEVFGQDENKWVTDRAISIINSENEKMEKEEMRLLMDELYIQQEKEALSKIDDNVEKLKLIMGDMNDGKKEG